MALIQFPDVLLDVTKVISVINITEAKISENIGISIQLQNEGYIFISEKKASYKALVDFFFGTPKLTSIIPASNFTERDGELVKAYNDAVNELEVSNLKLKLLELKDQIKTANDLLKEIDEVGFDVFIARERQKRQGPQLHDGDFLPFIPPGKLN